MRYRRLAVWKWGPKWGLLCCAGWLLCSPLLVGAVSPTARHRSPNPKIARSDSRDAVVFRPGKKDPKKRIREGTRILDQVGYFKDTGDGVTFYPSDGDAAFRGLENLALERIGQVIDETPGRVQWSISGTVTEFRGNNYVLITRAVLKTAAADQSSRP